MAAKPKAKPEAGNRWNNRIVGEGWEAPDQLLANPKNFRLHPADQQQALNGALGELGWIQRIIVNRTTGHVVDGHLRVAIAMRKNEATVPVVYVELTEAEEQLALATLDPISAMASADKAMLTELLEGISTEDAALAAFLADLAPEPSKRGPGERDPDAPIVLPAKARSRKGELYHLGDHRLLIADSTDPANVAEVMDGQLADALWTDPPYNVDYHNAKGKGIANDKMAAAAFRTFLTNLLSAAIEHVKPGGAIYLAHADSEGLTFRQAAIDAGWSMRQCLVWVKNAFTIGRQDYQWRHEPILYGWRPGAGHFWYGERTQGTVIEEELDLNGMTHKALLELTRMLIAERHDTVLEVPKPRRSEAHPTMKPVDLIIRTLGNSILPGERVLDVCGGSGSTLMAAEVIGSTAHLIELDPIYADATIARWQDYTDQLATRADGTAWNALRPKAPK